MKRKIKAFLVICCLAIALTLCLTACGNKCEHTYDNACDITCNECGEERTVAHDWSAATCTSSKTCKICGATDGEALGHEWTTPDVDLCEVQSTCSRCGATDGENKEHTPEADDGDCSTEVKCSVCGDVTTPAGQHTPNEDDGDCTTPITCSVCGTTTTPANANHTGGTATCTEKAKCTACGTAYGELAPNNHIDENTDHICDRECGATNLGTHADSNKDHACDYGCSVAIGTHADTNNDHNCEYGCSTTIGVHSDSENDDDHTCDYGCGATLEDCYGGTATCTAKAVCTVCGTAYGELDPDNHIDSNKDHICDRECGETNIGTHEDKNNDHACDYGCSTTIGTHADSDEDNDHVCDYGCGASLNNHEGGTATCTTLATCDICGLEYGDYNAENHVSTTEFTYTENGDGTHKKLYACCEAVHTASEACSGGEATCLHGKICESCGFEYDTAKNPENHASDVYTYADNEDDATHTKIHECGTTIDIAEEHTVTTWTHDGGSRHTGNCDHCGASLYGICEDNMDSTTGKCTVCDTLIAYFSVTSGETVTYYNPEDMQQFLGEDATVLKSGDTVTICNGLEGSFSEALKIPEGVTFDGGEFTITIELPYTLNNYGTIVGGTFECNVYNYGTITGGTFSHGNNVENDGNITGGTFDAGVSIYGGTVTGGYFYDMYIHSDCAISGNLTIEDQIMFYYTFNPDPEYYSPIDLSNATFVGWEKPNSLVIEYLSDFVEWNLNDGTLILPEGYCVFAWDSETYEYIHYTETMNSETRKYLICKHSHTLDGYGYDGDNHWKTCECGYADIETHTFDADNRCVCGAIQLTVVNAPDYGDHPFGVGWNNDEEQGLDSGASIGTQDVGKTAWEKDDQIIVTLISETIGTQTCVLTYDGGNWTLNGSFVYAEGETPTVTAVYAPASTLGMGDYIPANCTFANGAITIDFNGVTRNYSRLRIVGLPNQELTVTTTYFTPAGMNESGEYTYTLTTDDKGNAYLYGTFAKDATVSVKKGTATLATFTFSEDKDFANGTVQGKSYALDARPIIDGTLGGKATAEESDITALVEKLKLYVDNGITTITVTGSNPAIIDMGTDTSTAIGEAIYRLSGSGDEANSTYLGKIDLILPDVTEIVDYEFQDAYTLNSITLPKVTTVGDYAFYHCWYLQELTFGSVVTLITSEPSFSDVGRYVDGGLCHLVLNREQVNAATEYQPDLVTNVWWNTTPWKHITLI